ncbi:MAG: hypothetical protein GWM90_08180, partial [Gemmatimonadetes bacterium]|nr:hypothetical protein [Gemmatimonadota bacterium]NIQ53853.1 hypothetical protein [Gemmatimonadota bacterium]NIU74020.1 hypothetical protein [Gammaproteobacteria bacterium]NIX44089.1 hypothetical protein [Gemmatimonadota bacterium]
AAAFLRGLLGAAGAVRPTAPAVPVRDGTRAAERNTVTAWVGLAFPFDDVEGEALRLLGYRLREAIAPGPDRPGVLGVATEVERHPGGGALYVYFLSEPGDALAWSERVRDLVAETARAPLSTDVFAALLRRYRGV